MSGDTDGNSDAVVLRPAGHRTQLVIALLQVPVFVGFLFLSDGLWQVFPLVLIPVALVNAWSMHTGRTCFDPWGVRWRGRWGARSVPWTEVTEFIPERIQPAWLEVRLRSGRLKNLSQRPSEEQLRVLKDWHARAQNPDR